MIRVTICLVALAMLAIMSLRADRRWRHVSRLPMQWSLSGSVNWTAPRAFALAFMPILAAILFVSVAVAAPRAGQEGATIPVLICMAVTLVAIHALHLWLIRRTLDTDRR